MSLALMYITNRPDVALIAEKSGVDRIWIDLEVLGKEERQKGMNTVKSQHKIDDIKIIKPLLSNAELLVRVNPWNEGSVQEIDDVISAGADVIMLPMWKTVGEVEQFIKAVGGRCKTMLLLETKEAENCIDDVLECDGIDEIHIGLNDLHLSHNLSFMFELLSDGTVEKLCRKIAKKGLAYGFGGVAKLGKGVLPAEKIIMEHYRLGSTCAILSRSFCNADEFQKIGELDKEFSESMRALRQYESQVASFEKEQLLNNQKEVMVLVEKITEELRNNK